VPGVIVAGEMLAEGDGANVEGEVEATALGEAARLAVAAGLAEATADVVAVGAADVVFEAGANELTAPGVPTEAGEWVGVETGDEAQPTTTSTLPISVTNLRAWAFRMSSRPMWCRHPSCAASEANLATELMPLINGGCEVR